MKWQPRYVIWRIATENMEEPHNVLFFPLHIFEQRFNVAVSGRGWQKSGEGIQMGSLWDSWAAYVQQFLDGAAMCWCAFFKGGSSRSCWNNMCPMISWYPMIMFWDWTRARWVCPPKINTPLKKEKHRPKPAIFGVQDVSFPRAYPLEK